MLLPPTHAANFTARCRVTCLLPAARVRTRARRTTAHLAPTTSASAARPTPYVFATHYYPLQYTRYYRIYRTGIRRHLAFWFPRISVVSARTVGHGGWRVRVSVDTWKPYAAFRR